jgi:WNK lysine deficient protein kinase
MLPEPLSRRSSRERSSSLTQTDPGGRYVRQDDYVTVSDGIVRYLAFDHTEGLEVSWHELILPRWPSPEEWPGLQAECERLKQLRCDPLFAVHHYWVVPESLRLIFITDAIPAKSAVEDFLRETTEVRPKVVARWFRPILEVFRHLHSLSPPIVHGRIQPFSVFVRGPVVKVDLPRFPRLQSHCFSITPFTPPECLAGEDGPASDIWRFGIALLAVITRETPYAECKSPIELFTKLKAGELPASFRLVEDSVAAQLIGSCLQTVSARPDAGVLFGHEFFTRDYSLDLEKAPESGIVVIFKSQGAGAAPQAPSAEDAAVPLAESRGVSGSLPRLMAKVGAPA